MTGEAAYELERLHKVQSVVQPFKKSCSAPVRARRKFHKQQSRLQAKKPEMAHAVRYTSTQGACICVLRAGRSQQNANK